MSTKRQVTIELTETVCRLLTVLSDRAPMIHRDVDNAGDDERLREVLLRLADHAQQGVYRPGAWEREWICSAFGTEWIARLEVGDPYGRPGCESVFQRPRVNLRTGRAK